MSFSFYGCCWDQALRRHALKPSPICDCHDLSFRHSSDCHSYYRTHFLIVMTLFVDWRRPICHSSFVTFHYVTCHTPQRLSPLRLILSLSVLLRVPPSSDCTDCIYVFFIRLHSISHDPHSVSLTNSIPRRRRQPRLSYVFRSATSYAGAGHPPSADRPLFGTSRPPTMVHRPAPKGFHA